MGRGRAGQPAVTAVAPRPEFVKFFKKAKKMTFLCNFWRDERGQDLIEYTLLMAFVALASAALFMGAGKSVKGIWTYTNTELTAANTGVS